MRQKELANHLQDLKIKQIINEDEMNEILRQFSQLENHRDELTSHRGEIVVVYRDELFYGNELNEALKQAKKKFGAIDKKYYSETIDIPDYTFIYE
jgi:hypothetical protein